MKYFKYIWRKIKTFRKPKRESNLCYYVCKQCISNKIKLSKRFMFLNFMINASFSWIFYFLLFRKFYYLRSFEIMGIYSKIFQIIFNSHDGTCITKYKSKDTAIGICVHMINIEIVCVEFRSFFSWISKYFVQTWYWRNNTYIIKKQ